MPDPFAKSPQLKSRLDTWVTALMQVALGLGLLWLATQRLALDIRIHEPDMAISVAVTVQDSASVYVYSFNIPPLLDADGQDNQQEST